MFWFCQQLPQEQPEQGAAGGHCGGAAEEGEGVAAEAPAAPGQATGVGDHSEPAQADQPGQWRETAAAGEGKQSRHGVENWNAATRKASWCGELLEH